MRWSYTIARIAGTEVKVHVTFLLLLGWIAYDVWASAGAGAAVAYTLFFVAFFFCILLHEFGHITMARRFGVRTPDVILLPIGGVARLERIPEAPRQELLIALAGPAVTVAIIVVLFVAEMVIGHSAGDVLRATLATGRALFYGDPMTEGLDGPVNATAPHPVSNREFAETLGRVLGRPALLPVPAAALRFAFGEMAEVTVLAGARVLPARLQESGFAFRYPDLEPALRHLLGRTGAAR